MTGYCYNPVVPTSGGVEPLPSRCAHGADNNETISFDPKRIASAKNENRLSIIRKSPLANDYKIASAKTNLYCRTQCNKLATVHKSNKSNKIPDPGLACSVKPSVVLFDDMSLLLALDSTSDHMGSNHLAHMKGEKITGDVVYPVTPPANFSL